MPTASKRLAAGQTTLTKPVSTVYTCPPNHSTICKSLYLFNWAATAIATSIYLTSPGVTLYLVSRSIEAAGSWFWEGWAVLETGDQIVVNTDVAGLAYWISGSELLRYI